MPPHSVKTQLANRWNTADSGCSRPAPVKPNPARYEPCGSVAAWVLFAAIMIAVVSARIHLAALPLERDEGEYAYTGQLLLSGIAPYKLAYSMKFPGTSVLYAGLMAIFGESTTGLHIGLILINVATVGVIFVLANRLLGEIAGIASASAYAVLSVMPYVLGQAAHATHFVALPALIGAVVLERNLGRQSMIGIFGGGCLFGLAMVMKQPGFFFVIFGSVYLLSGDWRRFSAPLVVSRQIMFFLGAIAPFAVTCLYLWISGALGKFWFWTIKYAGEYGSRLSVSEGIRIFIGQIPLIISRAWPVWLIAAIGLCLCVTSKTLRPRRGFLLTFFVFSLLAVCPGFYFRPHYFILLLPAVSLLAGGAVMLASNFVNSKAPALRSVPILIFAAAVAWPIWREADFFFERPVREANLMVNGTNPFPESIKIGEYIRSQSNPTDTVAVLGSEPQIYFYAHRHSATGYIYTYALMEPQPYAHQMQEEMIREIEAANPRFLVLVVVNKSWLADRDSDRTIFKWADAYCEANYEEVGLINIFESGTDYYFSATPAGVQLAPDHILIYRRKT